MTPEQSLSRIERVRAHRAEHRSELREAIAAVDGTDDDGQWVAIGCPDCGVGTKQVYGLKEDPKPVAASAWNTRRLATGGAPASVPAGWKSALEVIRDWPVKEQDNFQAANMRKVAERALAASPTPEPQGDEISGCAEEGEDR